MLNKFNSKFYGRETAVDREDPALQETFKGLLNCIADIKASKWQALSSELEKCVKHFESGRAPLYRFQLELLDDVVVPYVQKLNNRYYTDEARERQLTQILHIATLPMVRHPADALLLVDKVAHQIRMTSGRKFFSFKSELLAAVDLYRDKKWRPLLWETKSFLQSVGAKLLGVGLVGLVGWPLALLYPLFLSTKQLSMVLRELDQRKTLSTNSIYQLVRLALITFASLQMVTILKAYVSVGYMALIAAALCFVASANDEAMKHIMPALAPYADLLDSGSGFSLSKLADLLHRQELGADAFSQPTVSSPLPPSSVRIEVLDDDDNAYANDYDDDCDTAASSSGNQQNAYRRSSRFSAARAAPISQALDDGEPYSSSARGRSGNARLVEESSYETEDNPDQHASAYATRLRKRKPN